jgi:hypothetical protein
MMSWPTKVWEPSRITKAGVQLWYSRIVTPEDRKRRQDYEDRYNQRQEGKGV